MLTHAILAAGRGTRLFGSSGGNKAMTRLGEGHLIDYVVREVEALAPDVTIVLVPEADQSIIRRVQALTSSRVIPVPSPSDGTGPGVRRLLAHASSDFIALSTCDLVAPRGNLTSFTTLAHSLVTTDLARCVVATSAIDESDPVPIYVHATNSVVTEYGKLASSSQRSFAGARLMNAAFANTLLQLDDELSTDTAMMGSIVAEHPGSVLHLDVDGLFDVDDHRALARAAALTREDRV